MNRTLIAFSMVVAFFGFIPTQASAQGTCAYVYDQNHVGRWIGPGCSGPQVVPQYNGGYYGGYPVQQAIPQVMPNLGSAINNCSVIGGVIGGVAGNRIDHHHLGGTIAGALLGGAVGNVVCSQGGQRVVMQQPQVIVIREGSQASQYEQQQMQTIRHTSTCTIDGRPELGTMSNLSEDQCRKLSEALAARRNSFNN